MFRQLHCVIADTTNRIKNDAAAFDKISLKDRHVEVANGKNITNDKESLRQN